MSIVCIIPARGGSVRLPRKNWRDFVGKPMIAYAIEVGLDHWLGIQIASRWFLVPVSGGIAAIGTDWADVAKWAKDLGVGWIRRKTGGEA